ncbi:DUF6233 domain-containing protein [Streptomyces sp. NPDC001953]
MNELPPDPPRLRVILAYLDQQRTENETAGVYLRLQRDKVRAALEWPRVGSASRSSSSLRRVRLGLRGSPCLGTRWVSRSRIGRLRAGPLLASLHLGDCDFDEGEEQRLDAHEAAVAPADGLAACVVRRPDAVLR